MDRDKISGAILKSCPHPLDYNEWIAMTDAVLEALAAHKTTKEEAIAAFTAFWGDSTPSLDRPEPNVWFWNALTAAYAVRFGKEPV
jgi:inosine-uridine nucleoside N-ribohydrolase